jgi:CubicO group peptidase (beta-lactamase class C family)
MRHWVAALMVACLWGVAPVWGQPVAPTATPATTSSVQVRGEALPGLQAFDDAMLATLHQRGYAGGTLAVSYQGRIVLNRAYGWADPSLFNRRPMAVDQRMRIASLSKAITAVAVLLAVQQGKLALDAPLAHLMGWPTDPQHYADPRVMAITVRHLLQNHAGWVIAPSADPMFASTPRCPGDALAWLRTQTLVTEPGQVFSYSNINFCLAQMALEQATGQPYASFVQQHIAQPLGIASWQLAQAKPAADEPAYMPTPDVRSDPVTQAILDGLGGAGAWTSSASDYLRLVHALRGYGSTPLLNPQSLAALWQRPTAPESAGRAWFYGLGLFVRNLDEGRVNLWHHGSLVGTSSYVASYANGWAVMANFNGRVAGAQREEASQALDRALWAAQRASTPPTGAVAHRAAPP